MLRLKEALTFALFSLLFGSKVASATNIYDSTTKVQLDHSGTDLQDPGNNTDDSSY